MIQVRSRPPLSNYTLLHGIFSNTKLEIYYQNVMIRYVVSPIFTRFFSCHLQRRGSATKLDRLFTGSARFVDIAQ